MLEDFLNTRAKTFIVFLFSVTSLGILAVYTQVAAYIFPKWYGIIAGVILMLLAVPLHLLARKFKIFYLFSYLANSIGCGFSVSAYYTTKRIEINFFDLIISTIAAAGILFLIYIMLQFFAKTKKVTLLIAWQLWLICNLNSSRNSCSI
jgi:hypothetical protein